MMSSPLNLVESNIGDLNLGFSERPVSQTSRVGSRGWRMGGVFVTLFCVASNLKALWLKTINVYYLTELLWIRNLELA